MLHAAVEKYGNSPYVLEKGNSGYEPKSYIEIEEESAQIASALYDLAFRKNDKISVLAEGRRDWVLSEFGILKAGCISVPLSIKLLPEEILFRLNHSESKAIIMSRNTIEKIVPVWKNIKVNDFKIFYLDSDLEYVTDLFKKASIDIKENLISFPELLEKGIKSYEKNKANLEKIEKNIEEDDIVTICYTSGTTGNPKGIMLTHLNYYSNSRDAMEYFNVKEKYRLMIILPLDHSFAHTVGIYASLVRGLAIYFVDARGGAMATLKNIPINLKEANANFLLTVPALSGNFMNKMKAGIEAKGGFTKWLFNKGMNAGMKINQDGHKKADMLTKLINYVPYKIADLLIFSKLRQIFGTGMQYCVGGGALLDIRQQRFFYTLGIPIYQGYGLTEATPIISANTPRVHKLGTSGKVLSSIDYKIIRADGNEADKGEKGELVIKGDNVMKGYFKNEKAAQETIKDGWLYTGDLGYIDEDDYLMITGREKALLISQDGEKYSPEEIEEAIANCSDMINQAMIHNDHNKYTSALISLNKKVVEKFCAKNKITNSEQLLKHISESFLRINKMDDYANKFPDKWIPSVFRIIEEPFSEQNKMINSTMKMVRYKIREAYHNTIEEMYLPDAAKTNKEKNIELLNQMFFN